MIAYFKRDEPKIPAHRRAVWDVLIGIMIFFAAVAVIDMLVIVVNAVEDAISLMSA